MNMFIFSYESEILLMSKSINKFIGYDGMYFNCDSIALSKHLVDCGFRFVGSLNRKELKYFKKQYKLYKKCLGDKK